MSDTSLTGAFDTGRLAKIADEPVTVTVSRAPLAGHEEGFEAWAERAAAVLRVFPGCLGVGVLRPGEPGGEWHIVSRFVDGMALRHWEKSDERAQLIAEVDALATDMKVQRTVGVDDWFDLADRAQPKRSPARRVVGEVLWVYPVALGVSMFVAPRLGAMALGVRTLVTGLLVGAVAQTTIGPIRRRLRRRRHFG